MSQQNTIFVAVSSLVMACALAFPGHATAAADDSVPTRLVLPTGSDGYPDPICSQCRAYTIKTGSSSAGDDAATVSLTFDGEGVAPYWSTVSIVVRLVDGEHVVIYRAPIWLDDGPVLDAWLESPAEWSWDEVEVVWIELDDASL